MLPHFDLTAMISGAYRLNDMVLKNGQAFPGLVRGPFVFNWHIFHAIGLLLFTLQDINSKHVPVSRLGRRSVASNELTQGLNKEVLIPDGFRILKSGDSINPLLGQITPLDKFDEFQEQEALGHDFKKWFREHRPAAEHDDEDEAYYDKSELRAAWYIYLKSKHPDLYLEELGKTSILEAVERQGDRSGKPERTMYAFLDQVFGTDGDEGATNFLQWMEKNHRRFERHRFYDLKSLYAQLLEWIKLLGWIEKMKGTTSLDEFPKKRYYTAWAKLQDSAGTETETITKLMNQEIYPLADISWEKSTMEPLLPKGSFENSITAQKFLDFLIDKVSHLEFENFKKWLMEKHSISEVQLQTNRFPRQHLSLNFVKWVDERLIKPFIPKSKTTYEILQHRKNEGVDAVTIYLLNQLNEEHPLYSGVPLDIKLKMKLGKLEFGTKMRLRDQFDTMGLDPSEKDKFMTHILQSNDLIKEREEFNGGKIWNIEDLKNFYQRWKGFETRENDFGKNPHHAGVRSQDEKRGNVKEDSKNMESSAGCWEKFKRNFIKSAKKNWNKIRNFYQSAKEWFKKVLHLGPDGYKPLKDE